MSGFFPDASEEDFKLYLLNLEIPDIEFSINRHQEEKLFTFEFKKFVIFGDIKNKQQILTLTINDMSLLQYQLTESKYTTILTTVQQKNDKFKEDEKKTINAFHIELQKNPDFPLSNFRISFRNQKRIIVIANIYSLKYISTRIMDYITFFTDPNFDFPERYNTSGEIYKFIKEGLKIDNTVANLQHFNAELDVKIKSPIILLPMDMLDDSNKKCILVRCGDFNVISILPPRQDPKINYAEVKERVKLFDVYMINSGQLCVTTLENFDGDLSRLLEAKGQNIIEDVSFGLNTDILFESKNKYFEQFKVEVKVGNCKINIRDKQIPFLMEMIDKSEKLLKLAMYELENKTYFERKEIRFNKEEEDKYVKTSQSSQSLTQIKEIKEIRENLNEKKDESKIIINNDNNNNNINNIIIQEEKEEKENNDINTFQSQQNEIKNENNINNNNNNDNKELIKKENKDNKDDKQIDDPKLLIFSFHMAKFQFCIQKTISYGEREILSKLEDEKLKNLIYRDFLIFDINTIKIELLLTEKYNANATLLIKSISIIDKETLITNANNPEGDLYVNKEFQHLINMDSGENNKEDIPKYFRRQLSSDEFNLERKSIDQNMNKNSNNNNNKNNKKDDHNQYFMVLNIIHNNDTQTQLVDVVFKKIKVCISMSTISRTSQFLLYYLDMFNKINEQNLLAIENMEREHQKKR